MCSNQYENDNQDLNGYDSNEDCKNPNLTKDQFNDEKMKGDAIGDTMYSERYVLKTLLQLEDNDWNEELENDLCSIWDMTTEKDVVQFLLDNNFLDLSISIIKETRELRLVEIMVGIIGNMCVHNFVSMKLVANQEAVIIFNLLTLTDSPILIQLMRLYKALLFNKNIACELILSENCMEEINFILKSSQNIELLLYTMQVTSAIINRKKSAAFVQNIIIDAVNEAFKELSKNYKDDMCVSRDFEKCINSYVNVLEHTCAALRDFDTQNENYCKFYDNLHDTHAAETLNCISTVLKICCDPETLCNESESTEYYLYYTLLYISTFKMPFYSDIFKSIIDIFETVIENEIHFEIVVHDSIVDFITNTIETCDLNSILSALVSFPTNKLKIIFVDNIKNKTKCCDDVVNKIEQICNV